MATHSADDQAIFENARRMEAEKREGYLQGAGREFPDVESRVRALLAAYEESASFLEVPAVEFPATLLSPSLELSSRIGPYKLLQEIGEGGMGMVFLAEQQEPVKRQVALKLIKPGMGSRQVIARFEAERQALAMMDHPYIARVLDGGTTEQGLPYFVMELVQGVPITQFCDENHLSLKHRLELFVPVCQAIQHAHQKGIIHRDLKPSNVLIAEYDGQATAKVIDFGVAKAMGSQLTEKTMFTAAGQLMGTLEYMSPEQARLNHVDIDTRSDIYSLGVLLYELLTGSTPFDRTLESAAFDEVLRVIREQEPPRPSLRLSSSDTLPSVAANRNIEPARLSRSVRGELDWIVMKALEKNRNRRYETATGLAHDIENYLSDEPVTACPPSMWYRLRKFIRRNRTAFIVSGVLSIALGGLIGAVGWAVRDRAAVAEEVEQEKQSRRMRMTVQIKPVLEEIEANYQDGRFPQAMASVRQAEVLLAEPDLDETFGTLVRNWRSDLEMIAAIERIRLDQAAGTDDGKWDWSVAERAYQDVFLRNGLDIDALKPADAARQIQARRIHVQIAVALDEWASVRRLIPGMDPTAWRQLIEISSAADPDPLRSQLRSLWGRAITESRGEIEKLAASSTGQKKHPTTVVLLSRVLRSAKFLAEAEAVLREGQAQYPNDFWINYYLANLLIYEEPKRVDEAAGFLRAALAQRPDSGLVYSNLGVVLQSWNRQAEAERAFRQAIRLAPKFASLRAELANLLQSQQRWLEAIAAYEEAIRIDPENAGPYANLAKILTNCPDVRFRDIPRAVAAARKSVEISPQWTWSQQMLGWAEYRRGHWQASIDALEKSCTLQGDRERGDSFQWYFLAMAHSRLGNEVEARKWYDQATRWTERFWVNSQEELDLQAEAAGLLGLPLPTQNFRMALRSAREHFNDRRWTDAEREFRRAISLNANSAVAHNMLGQTLKRQGRIDDAGTAFREAARLAPRVVEFLHDLGEILAQQGRWDEADPLFQEMIRLEPENAQTHHWYAAALAASGKLPQAETAFREAIRLDPNHAERHHYFGDVLRTQNKDQEAEEAYRRAIRLNPDGINSYVTLNDPDEWEKLIDRSTKLVALAPYDANAWHRRGLARVELGHWKEAEADLSRAIQLDPKPAIFHTLKGRALKGLKQWQRALDEFDAAVGLEPQTYDHWFYRGVCHAAMENWEQAIADYTKALELHPGASWLWVDRGRAMQSLKLWQAAEEDFSRALTLNPVEAASWNHRGHVRQAQGKFELAIADFTKALELNPRMHIAYARRALASHAIGNSEQAIADMTRAWEINPSAVWLLEARARFKANQGDLEMAFTDYERAVRLDPNSVNASVLEARELLSAVLPNDPRFHQQWGLEATQAPEAWALTTGSTVNDPRFNQQYGLEVTEADAAWSLTTGSTQVVVAINDTGIDYIHPDLYLNIWINQNEIPPAIRHLLVDIDSDGLITFWDLNDSINQGPETISDLNGTGFIDGGDLLRPITAGGWADGIDTGGNGYLDDLIGWDFINNDNDPMDVIGHGTLVAGVIGAIGNNGIGVAGLNWQVQLMPIVRGGEGATVQHSVDAIYYAVDNGARISNHSYSAPAATLTDAERVAVEDVLAYAQANDHLVVAAGGNQSSDNDVRMNLPASGDQPNIISVAATNKNDKLAQFSNIGVDSIDLGAPGVGIWTTVSGGGYAKATGTSFAAPHVAGAAALLLALNPNLNVDELKSLMLNHVDPLADLEGVTVTGGRLNVSSAITTATQLEDSPVGNSEYAGVSLVSFIANDFLTDDVSEGSPTSTGGMFESQGVDLVSGDPKDWAMFGHDPEGTRHNRAENQITTETAQDLQEIWRFPTDGAVAGTPAVVNDIVYAADTSGAVYAVNRDGTLKWKTVLAVNSFVGAKFTASPLVTNRTVILGDNAGFIHGLDVATGAVKWSVSPNPHPFAAIFGNGTMVGNYVAFGTSSFELLVPALDPTYTNFTFRGSVVLLDPTDGSIIWQTFTITDAEQAQGASGATVWGAPVYDRGSDTIFVGTSNNYSLPTTETSDALMAFNAKTGEVKWVSQKTGGDHWNFSFLPEDPDDPPDFDFGDTPQLYPLNGRPVVAAGQKSGFFHVVDAETGAEIAPPQQFLAGDHLGGFHIDSAYADGANYAPGNDWFDPFSGNPPTGGHLFAITADGTQTLWEVDLPAPVISGAAVAGGVVYVQSIDGLFYGFDAETGEQLVRLETGGQNSGPAISRGRIYLGTGDSMSAVFNPFFSPGPAEIISLGLVSEPNHGSHENSPPTFINRTLAPSVKVGEFVTLTGTIVDPDPLDTFYLTVDWGDGRVETLKFSPKFNGQTVSITHLYEKPGTYEIQFSWRDRRDFGNSAVLTTTILENLAPVLEQSGEGLVDTVLDADFFDELA